MISKVILLLLICVVLVTPVCKNPSQSEGECSQCGPVDILISKNCYPKIRGCMVHIAGPKCTQCQFGYVLHQQTCIRQAVWDEMQNKKPKNETEIPPVVIGTPTLTLDQIKLQVGEQYGGYFTDAHQLFLNKYPELGKGNIKSVDKLDTKKGVYFVTVYESTTGQKYQATSFVDSLNTVKQISFVPLCTQRKDPFTGDSLIKQAQGANLNGYSLYQAKLSGDNYTYDYMNSNLSVIRVDVNKNDIGPLLSTKAVVKKLNATDLAKQEMVSKYPAMASQKVSKILRFQDFHIFVMTPNYTCSVRFNNNKFLSNKPVTIKKDTYFLDSLQLMYNWFGFYTLFAWLDPKYYACLDLATATIPQISSYTTTNVQTQSTNLGTMYSIELSRLFYGDSFKVTAIYLRQGYPKLAEIWKNGALVYTENYNYNYDGNFFKWYLMAVNTSKVLNIPAIDNVTIKFSGVQKYYKVNYVPTEHMQFTYNTSSRVSKLITYTVQGQNIVDLLNKVGPSTQKKQPQVIFDYLIKQQYTNPFSFLQSFFGDTLTWISNGGTYRANVKQNTTSLIVDNVQQVSTATCCDVSNWAGNKKFKAIDSFLRSNYNLNELNVILAQNKINDIGNRYRMLYSNPKLKQIEFIVQELYTLFNVIKSNTLNGGYSIVQPVSTNTDYQKLVNYLSSSVIAGNKIPLLTESNSNSIRGYCNDGTATKQIILTRSGGAKVTNIATRQYLLVPNGFKLQNLIVPGDTPVQDQDYLQLIHMQAQQAHPSQLADSTLAFADKNNNNYNLLYKSNVGTYYKLPCSLTQDLQIHLGQLQQTNYKQHDFTTCTHLSKTGACLSCQGQRIQYQGSCFNKIQGCMAQAGAICLRCSGDYILQDKVCKRACTDLI